MVSVASLWLPILLSAVGVFILSSILHMVVPHHRSDYSGLPSEEEALEAWRKLAIPPGDYIAPFPATREVMKSAGFQEKLRKGPVMFLTVVKPGPFRMGPSLAQWFVYCLAVALLCAFLAGHALRPGAGYPRVFHVVGLAAFMAHSAAVWHETIWYKRKWSTSIKNTVDGLLYGLLTAGIFGWLWPK